MSFNNFQALLSSWASFLAVILATSYVFSLAARSHWFLDLFSHFTIQYAIGGFILGLLLLYLQNWPLAFICLFIFGASAYETRYQMDNPWQFQRPVEKGNLTVVQYNKLYRNNQYERMGKWLRANANNIDLLLVQESGESTIEDLKQYKDIFPYQYPQKFDERFNDVSILSRYPFKVEPMVQKGTRFINYASRIELKKEIFKEPVVIYSFHTKVPMGKVIQNQRNEELRELAQNISNDNSELIIASGDWNITPYSPYFKDFLEVTGLLYQNFGALPETTWPSPFLLPFLKIPIDQMLYKDGLKLTSIERGPSLGSDHHMLIATYLVPERQ